MTDLISTLTVLAGALALTAAMSPRVGPRPRHLFEAIALASYVGLFFVMPWLHALLSLLLIGLISGALRGLDQAELRFRAEWRAYIGGLQPGRPVPESPTVTLALSWALAHHRDAAGVLAGLALSAMAGSCENCGRRPATERTRVARVGRELHLCVECVPHDQGPVFAR